MSMAAILVMWPGLFEHKRIYMKFDFDCPNGF